MKSPVGNVDFPDMQSQLIRSASWFGAVFFCLYIATIAVVSWYFPSSNWDMVAYIASILDTGGISHKELHGQSWAIVESQVSKGEFLVLTSDRPYRIRQYADAEAFYSMLGFYKVKYLYIYISSVIAKWTDPLKALRIISVISVLGTGAITLFWLRAQRCLFFAPLGVAILILAGFGNIAVHIAPDLFASFFIILSVFFYLRKIEAGCTIALFLAFLARPDHLAFVAVLTVASFLVGGMWKGIAAAFVASLASYFAITKFAGHPGWWVQMWFTHIEYVPTLIGFNPEFSVAVYAKIVIQTLVRSLVNENWLAILLLLGFFRAMMRKADVKFTRDENVILTAAFATIFTKFFVFPLVETRFHFGYLVVIGLIFLTTFGRHKNPDPLSVLSD